MKQYFLPSSLEMWIQTQLSETGFSLQQPRPLAQSIQKMADFYIAHPTAPTPWHEPWCQQAQLAYYFPLNFLRNLRVFQELHSLHFFDQPFSWYEWGPGLGPSLEAYLQVLASHKTSLPSFLKKVHLLETSTQARTIYQHRLQKSAELFPIQWMNQWPTTLPPQSLLVFSYSLTEIKGNLPDWIWSADSIIIIDPSTQEDGRRLMALREAALSKNFQVIAPCTHHQKCPLLLHSQKDWCHDRLGWSRPSWMLEIEKHLPFKNQTLTLSYLALKRQPSFNQEKTTEQKNKFIGGAAFQTHPTRVVGDFLNEKGKTRQLICRSSEREFISFIKRATTPIEFFRGDLLNLSESIEKKGDELRPITSQVSKMNDTDL